MGLTVTKARFNYSATDEPHATRRREILAKHPEIKQLFGIDESFKYVVAAMVLTQTAIAFTLHGEFCTQTKEHYVAESALLFHVT